MKDGDFVLELLKKRKTTYEFCDKKVNDKDLIKILEAGRFAPSNLNIQPWHFIVIQNPQLIDKLMGIAIYGHFHTSPNMMIVFVLKSDYYDKSVSVGLKGQRLGFCEAFLSMGMPALSMALEATALGIDSCFLTLEDTETYKLLKLQDHHVVPVILGLGYEKKGVFQKKKERKNLKDILSYETYKGKKSHG